MRWQSLLFFICFVFHVFCLAAQGRESLKQPSLPDVLESTLAATVTVAVYKDDYGANQVMTRGSSASEQAKKIAQEAYQKALDLGDNSGSGSGFIVEMGGKKYVITNYHVIATASRDSGSIQVFSVSRTPYEVKLVGGDALYDVAVLEFVAKPGKDVRATKFRNTEARIGERVFAIGNPGGNHPFSVSDGIISAKNRALEGLTSKFGYLQTTATVIWGNSGGPLIDERGNVVGINTRIDFATDNSGGAVWTPQINYALESRIAQRVVSQILNNNGRVMRAFFGIEFSQEDYSDDGGENVTLQKMTVSPIISGLLPNTPAASAMKGLLGARVKSVNGELVRSMEELLGALEATTPSQDVEFIVQQDTLPEQKIKVRSNELKGEQLDAIARYVFSKDRSLRLIEKNDRIIVQMQPSKLLKNDANVVSAVNSQDFTDQWRLIAAGLNSTYVFKVFTLSDLGAAIKLSSMAGSFDVKMIPNVEPAEGETYEPDFFNPKLFKFVFSEKKDLVQGLLYY